MASGVPFGKPPHVPRAAMSLSRHLAAASPESPMSLPAPQGGAGAIPIDRGDARFWLNAFADIQSPVAVSDGLPKETAYRQSTVPPASAACRVRGISDPKIGGGGLLIEVRTLIGTW